MGSEVFDLHVRHTTISWPACFVDYLNAVGSSNFAAIRPFPKLEETRLISPQLVIFYSDCFANKTYQRLNSYTFFELDQTQENLIKSSSVYLLSICGVLRQSNWSRRLCF